MTLTREVAARYLGMKVDEVRDLVDTDDGGTLATTHDGRQTLIGADGTVTPQAVPVVLVAGPAPVPAPAGVLVDAAHDPVFESIADVGQALADEFDLDPAAVEAFLAERFSRERVEPVGPGPEPLPQRPEQLPENTLADRTAPLVDGPDVDPDVEQVDQAEPVAIDEASDAEPVDEPVESAVPDGNADVVIAWVGDDKDRAREALDRENQRPTPRGTVIARLNKVVTAE